MTLNILFLTVTIKKRMMSAKEYLHHEMVKKIEEENRNKHIHMNRMF
jgi:uncharacterized protein (TIGR02413 family)